jgi:hypothetical protein
LNGAAPARGLDPWSWQDHAAAPHIGEHESPGGSFRPGTPGLLAAGVMADGPSGFGEGDGGFGAYWAFRALGAGMNGRQQRPMAARPDVTRGLLTPATEDLAALVATGESPTVLAFALGRGPGVVVYEVLNQPEPMTFVYRADGTDGLATINRALDDAGFQPAAVHADGLAAQVPHDAQWPDGITRLLAD